MNKKIELLGQIEEIFKKELNDQELKLEFNSSSNTVENWDSINNIVIISKIESQFNISFPIDIIFEAENIGDLINYIYQNTND